MFRLSILVLAIALSACSGEAENPAPVPERDPAVVQALGDQIMVDPDLSQQNEANAALTGGTDHSLPPVTATREAIEAARLEAADLVGGVTKLLPPEGPMSEGEPLPEPALYSVTELARLTPGAARCTDDASFTAAWAAKVPPQFPIYPRGNTIEAAGSDAGGCALRAVRYLTPVEVDDVIAFYAARARQFGLATTYAKRGEHEVLAGSKGAARFAVYVRRRASGIAEVGLVTLGF